MIGLTLLALAIVIGASLCPQARRKNESLQTEISAARDSAAQVNEQRRNTPSSVSQLKSFLESLPPLNTNANDVQKLFIVAKESGVDLTKADYQLTSEPGLELVRYLVTVPIKDKYLTVRRFATGALNALPHLALDELQFARTQASTDEIDAQLRFTLFYRP